MKLYIELILTVSLTGTVPFCVYLLLKRKLDNRVSACFQYNLLKFILLCFLCPFALLKSILASTFFPPRVHLGYVYLDNAILKTQNGILMNPSGGAYRTVIPIWGILLSLIVCRQLFCYLRFRYRILLQLAPANDHRQNEFSVQRTQAGLRRPVSLFYWDADVSPFTFGFFHPCIVLTSAVLEDSVSMAIRHELQHIRSHDFLFRAAAFLAVLIHCWNPFIYLLWKEFCEVQELACDEKITAPLSPEAVKQYGCSIVAIAAHTSRPPVFTYQMAQNGKKSLRRRIVRLSARFDRRSRPAAVLLLLACLAGFCLTVYARSPEIIDARAYCIEDVLESGSVSISDIPWVYLEEEEADKLKDIIPEGELYSRHADQYPILEGGAILE